MPSLKRTALYDFHLRNNGRMVPFANWEMPVQYTGIMEEHRAVRQKVGLFDVSHMGEAKISGPQAEAFLNYIMTNDVSKLQNGSALYSLMCYSDGGVVDDVIVYRLAKDDFLVCLNASNIEKDIAWLSEHLGTFECTVSDVSLEYAQLALQGPRAEAVLNKVTKQDWSYLKLFKFEIKSILGIFVIVSRTGYTGEDGFELYCPSADVETIANALFNAGQSEGLVLAGLGARDSLRLEAGFSLYGHEISQTINPLQAGLGWIVKLKKEGDFIGRQALEKEKAAGVSRKIVFFKIEDRRIARQGAPVYDAGKLVGEVVSGTFSPILNQPIGSALIEINSTETELEVELRGQHVQLTLEKPPLFKR